MSFNLLEVGVFGLLGVTALSGGVAAVIEVTSPTPVKEIASPIEAWSVFNPQTKIPTTDGYVFYTDFARDKADQIPYSLEDEIPQGIFRSGNVWIKVNGSSNGSSFSICTHKGGSADDFKGEIISYDSMTGEELENEDEICRR